MADINKICVIGAGVMGSGIVQLLATYGYNVTLVDENEEILNNAKNAIEKNLERFFVSKNKISKEEAEKYLNRIHSICDKEVILASNTSSLSITEIASESIHQDRIVGIHFFNPPTVMKLIELIKGKNTSEKTLKIVKDFSEGLKKTVVIVNDSPGFVTSRLIYVMCNEAINMKLEGIASTEDIDTACKLAFNFPMGPLELSDLVGLDVYL